MLLLKLLLQTLLVSVPHVIALPAVVVFRCRWGVNHAAFSRFIFSWFLAVPVMLGSALVLGDEPLTEAVRGEINRSWAWMAGFGFLSWGMFLTGRIRQALRPPSELSVGVGQVRYLPPGTFYQMVPTLVLVALALANHFVWKHLRPLSTVGAFYGLMMAWDYLKACNNDRAMRIGVNDAVIRSEQVRPPEFRSPPSPAARGGESSTGELVRIYGRSRGR